MAERRLSKRQEFRKIIKYGISNPEYTGFTYNISEAGIGVKTNNRLMPKARIIADLFLGEETLRVLGVIIWSDLGIKGFRSQMGIKITSRPERIKDIYSKLASMNTH